MAVYSPDPFPLLFILSIPPTHNQYSLITHCKFMVSSIPNKTNTQWFGCIFTWPLSLTVHTLYTSKIQSILTQLVANTWFLVYRIKLTHIVLVVYSHDPYLLLFIPSIPPKHSQYSLITRCKFTVSSIQNWKQHTLTWLHIHITPIAYCPCSPYFQNTTNTHSNPCKLMASSIQNKIKTQ